MNEEEIIEKIKIKVWKIRQNYSNDYLFSYYWTKDDVKNVEKVLDLYNQEQEKNKKLEEVINNLAQAIRFMSTNEKLTVEDIIKEFTENQITEEFMERWEKSQHEESHLKDKVIDMIASDYIQDYLYNERSDYPCEYYYGEIKKKDGCKQGKIGVCKECIKEYYFKKAREE